MLPLEVVFAALFGLTFGSFLNVCIVRLPRGKSVVHPPSHCPRCGSLIKATDNIPVLSWILLRGRGRCCSQPISLRYPLVEAGTAALSVLCLLNFGLSVTGAAMALLCWLLLGLAWMDAETYLLPDAFTLPGLALGLLFQSLRAGMPGLQKGALQSLLGAAALGGLLFVISVLYRSIRHREGMGMGDVKLAAMLGTWMGWQLAAVALFIAIIGGAAGGLVLLTGRKTQGLSGEVQEAGEPLRLPFGSFLAAAGILTVFVGRPVLAWYLKFF